MMVMISDESYPGWKTVYRGSISTTWADVYALEESMPLWLLEYVLFNKAVVPPASKISFVLLPWPNPDPDGEQLPELLNVYVTLLADHASWLTIDHFQRAIEINREQISSGTETDPSCRYPYSENCLELITSQVQEKLEKLCSTTSSTSASSVETPIPGSPSGNAFRIQAEETYEILCNDTVLSLDMILAAVRQYFWRQSSELTMYYRLRSHPSGGAG
ncbi:hypothetical protein JVT61DRAFT_2152 [Boletus reticuloceps]|uniref:Uncharacterized protein n=1 Tax=Boletus reticuloceps TaxID=495285 RepID=A0A8I3A8U8_9AGAM|nr:hypothetical protein JVT61DRAFT_2152 [Boletus reticuloceps]